MTMDKETMDLAKLYHNRARAAQKQGQYYLHLLFNDHFVVFLLLLVGGAILAFQSLAKHPLTTAFTWLSYWQLGLIIWLVLGQQLGSFLTYLRPADRIFLAASDNFLTKIYLHQAWLRSFYLAGLWQLLFLVLAEPVLLLINRGSLWELVYYFLALWASKAVRLVTDLVRHQQGEKLTWLNQKSFFYLVKLILPTILSLVIVLLPKNLQQWFLPVIIVLAGTFVVLCFRRQKKQHFSVNWPLALVNSRHHDQVLWQFYGLFAQVPHQEIIVKRRPQLDILLARFSFQKEPLQRLFWIRLLRTGDELALVLRLTAVGLILLLALPVKNYLLQGIGMALLVYLINFQLIPVYEKTRGILWTRLAFSDQRLQERKFLTVLAEITGCLLILAFLTILLVSGPGPALAVLFGGLSLALFLYRFWLPHLLRKKK